MTDKDYGLVPASERPKRSKVMRSRVLNFMYYQPYKTAKVIQALTEYKTLKGALNILHKLEKQGFVKSYRLPNIAGRGMMFWGITRAGCAAIYDPDVHIKERTRGFRSDAIYMTTLDHLIAIQSLECRLMSSERDFSLLQIDEQIWKKKVPDIIALLKYGDNEECIYAFEVELTIKSKKRYRQIVQEYSHHLGENGNCDKVFWCVDTESKKRRLSTIFKNINSGSAHEFRTLEELKT